MFQRQCCTRFVLWFFILSGLFALDGHTDEIHESAGPEVVRCGRTSEPRPISGLRTCTGAGRTASEASEHCIARCETDFVSHSFTCNTCPRYYRGCELKPIFNGGNGYSISVDYRQRDDGWWDATCTIVTGTGATMAARCTRCYHPIWGQPDAEDCDTELTE